MYYAQVPSRQTCSLLAVFCGEVTSKPRLKVEEGSPLYPFPELVSSGRLEVQTLTNPTTDEFRHVLELSEPNFVYLQGQQFEDEEEIGSLVWGDVHLSSAEAISGLFGAALPTTVYLEIPNGEKLAEALHSKGVPYVIYWKNTFSCFAACHFRQALLSVVQSSCSHTWDAFQLAHASFRLYCVRNNRVLPANCQKISGKLVPRLLGDPPKINIIPPVKDVVEEEEDSPNTTAVKIYDDDVTMRFLICGVSCTLDACLLGALEDGLNALLSIEIRGSKLHNRISATPPPLQAGTFSRGVVTMRCDLSTCSSAHISLLVSGSAETCFDDQLLESHIKKELIERSQLVHALPSCEESKPSLSEPRKSASIACGATIFEVCMKVPTWASQVLRQLAPEISYHSFVTLGIASIQGLSVASFDKDDAERLLFFCTRQGRDTGMKDTVLCSAPSWFKMPAPSRKRIWPFQEAKSLVSMSIDDENGMNIEKSDPNDNKRSGPLERMNMPLVPIRKKLKVAAMRPIPHTGKHKMLPFLGVTEVNGYDSSQGKANLSVVPSAKQNHATPAPSTHRKMSSSAFQAQQIISLNPLPLKKHGCGRSPIQACSEEEFLRDVMEFLILRGHNRLIPQGGLAEFPDAILNAKRLDLYNLYREVVSRGGFHVGNGINWKGQVFSKMRNHTMANRMTMALERPNFKSCITRIVEEVFFIGCLRRDYHRGILLVAANGVGNTLKRHYETYLLEYELAHDDVDGECCLLCHSSAAGDWVNCGICGEWAHFGCDRRQGLGAFKDYAKTDGLEYICPHCSLTSYRKKSQKMANGYPQASMVSRTM